MDSTSEGEYTSGDEEEEEPDLIFEQEEALKNSQTIEGSKVEETVQEDVAIEGSDPEERRFNIQQWMEKLAKVKREEFEREEAAKEPLKHYLMAHLVPTLTTCLIDVTRATPEDPVEYMAEFAEFLASNWANNPGSLNTTACEKFPIPKTEEKETTVTTPKLEDPLVNE